jgi:hypothetical protein
VATEPEQKGGLGVGRYQGRSEILGWGGAMNAELMLYVTHENCRTSLLIRSVRLSSAPIPGDIIQDEHIPHRFAISDVAQLDDYQIVTASTEYAANAQALLKEIIATDWEILSIDHEMN